MGILTSVSFDEICSRGSIKDGDVLKLRRAFSDDPTITSIEADQLLTLNDVCRIKDPAWAAFFVEAITDYIVGQAKPEGYVTAEQAQWLIDRIGKSGRIDGSTELETLVHVLEAARWSPSRLVQFALAQVKNAVVTGAGPLRTGQTLEPGAISPAEIKLLARILLAFGGDGHMAVTRAEADVLIEIEKAIAPGKSSPAWTQFYVRAVGNAVLAGLGYVVPSRQDVLDADPMSAGRIHGAPIARIGGSVRGEEGELGSRTRLGEFYGRMIAGGAGSIWASCRLQSPEERAMARLERQRLEIITNEPMPDVEETWLVERLGHNGRYSDNETTLLAYLKREATVLPSRLTELAAKAAIAA